jgi:hypothetical protein
MQIRPRSTWLAFLFALALTGCGSSDDTPPLGRVSGVVTLDGAPLEGVIILFQPEKGRAATGTTDAAGKYELEYAYDVPGCKTGPNVVKFEWPLGSTNAKALSTRYTSNSELKEEVAAGKNAIDFKLETDGKGKAKKLVIPD